MDSRYNSARAPAGLVGWKVERATPPSRMFGANGLLGGPDGRIYVAQCVGSQISALDPGTGELSTISPQGGDIVAPDDLVFDDAGNMYVTELMDGRVSRRDRSGATTVIRGDIPAANGITMFRNRLFVDECRFGGRLLEIDLHGGSPRVLVEGLQLPNALAPGPDGWLYYPVIAGGEIWRIHPDGGTPELVIGGLDRPNAVKFDARGRLHATLTALGQVVSVDMQRRSADVVASLETPLDNLAFIDDRLFVSRMVDGRVTEVVGNGAYRDLLPGGLHGPLDLALDSDNLLYIADQIATYVLMPSGELKILGQVFDPTYPGGVRGIAPLGDGGFIVTSINGHVARYYPWRQEFEIIATGLDRLYGVDVLPSGAAIVVEQGAGRVLEINDTGDPVVLAADLLDPVDVLVAADGSCLVSESGANRIVRIGSRGAETVVDGLNRPQGIAIAGSQLFVVDAGSRSVLAINLETAERQVIATDLPIGSSPGVIPKVLRGCEPIVGALGPFAGIAIASEDTIYISGDAEGSVIVLKKP